MTLVALAVLIREVVSHYTGLPISILEWLVHFLLLFSYFLTVIFAWLTRHALYTGYNRQDTIAAVNMLLFFHLSFLLGLGWGSLMLYSAAVNLSAGIDGS